MAPLLAGAALLLAGAAPSAAAAGGAVRIRARMVTVAGGNHGRGNKCMNHFGNEYLRTGALPARDECCHRAGGKTSRAIAARRHRLGIAGR